MPAAARALNFNLAHADGFALYAFTYGRAVGIDVELVDSKLLSEELIERFSPLDVGPVLARAAPRERRRLFIRNWTEREARVKAAGGSLASDIDARATQRLAAAGGAGAGPQNAWQIIDLPLGEDYTGCVAVPPGDYTLHCYGWSEAVSR
jgi:4'-phosphopantetheinyl transferase